MSNYKYSFQKYDPKSMAKVIGTVLPISHKKSREIAKSIKNKQIDKAITYLELVTELKQAVPYKRYNRDVPHKPGKVAAARYPAKTAQHIIKLIKSLKSNAQDKGLDTTKLTIVHAAAQKGDKRTHYGRRRTERKNTHFELVAQEKEQKPKKKTKKKVEKPKEKKPTAGAPEQSEKKPEGEKK